LSFSNKDPSESSEAAGETRDIAIVRIAPSDLPEHSLVSYNPNRTRFEPPHTPSNPSGWRGTVSEEESQAQELVETQFPAVPKASTPQPPKPPVQEERLRLLRLIGRGGCGEVWEGLQVQLGRAVAVKRLREDRYLATERDESREEMIRFFREEALIAARLDHPNIVPVYDYSRNESGDPELSMKLVRGRPWDKLLKTDRKELKFEDLLPRHLAILADVANSVAFAHSRKIVHRDIKPSQVMVGDYGEVLLMDWGLALVFGEETGPGSDENSHIDTSVLPTLSTASSPAGTPAYMAPEQTLPSAEFIGPWTDVYLLGGCLYCILVGTGPYGDSPSHEAFLRASEAIVRDPREVMPDLDIPDELAELAMNALKREPRDRIESASAFVKKLEDWISGASRRRESEGMTDEIAEELKKPRSKYSEFVSILSRVQQAAGLWTGNPALPQLRARTLIEYGELALAKGDLLLAQTEAELLAPSPERDALLQRVDVARAQRARTRKYLKVAGVVVSTLIVVLIVGGTISNRVVNRALEESMRQTVSATEARDLAQVARTEAERAREVALNEQIYAQIRYATSLVDAGRHDMAKIALWSIPESARNWEWAYLISRSYQPLAEFPFRATEVSTRGEWIFVDDPAGNVQVRDTMAGALVAILDHETTEVLVLPPRRDTHVDTLDGGKRLLRWAPPDWQPQVVAEFPSRVVRARRVYRDDDFLVGFEDKSVAILDGGTGVERLRVPPIRDNFVAIDAYPPGDLLAVAGTHEVALYSISQKSLLRHFETLFSVNTVGIIDRGRKVLVYDGLLPHVYNVATGDLERVSKFGGHSGVGAFDPESAYFARMPDYIDVKSLTVNGQFPVTESVTAKAKFVDAWSALFWGGTSGEAGLYEFLGSRFVAPLRGLDSPITNMWAVERAIWEREREVDFERILTATEDGKTQVWLIAPNKFIARLPGQWGSFRDNGTVAVSIGSNEAYVQRLDDGTPPFPVGNGFSLYQNIRVNKDRGKIYSFGRPLALDNRFGWEIYDMATRSRESVVAAGTVPYDLPAIWVGSFDDTKVAIIWNHGDPCEIWSADEGILTAKIESTGATVTNLIATPWGTLYTGDTEGIVAEYSLSDGSLIRKVDVGSAVWTLRYDNKGNRLFVADDNNNWRLFAASESGLELQLTQATKAGPVIMANFGSGGNTLLTQTLDRWIGVYDLPSGKETLRFKVDVEIPNVKLSPDGNRIFGIGSDGLYVWDMLGREVARVPGVRDISPESRRLLITQDKFLFSRDLVVELPPHDVAALPGESSQSFEERYQLYRQSEYRRWFITNETEKLPGSLQLLADMNRGTIAELGPSVLSQLSTLIRSLGTSYANIGTGIVPLLRMKGRLASSVPEFKWNYYADHLLLTYHFCLLSDPVAKEIIRGVKPYVLLSSASVAIERARYPDSPSVQEMLSAIHCLAELGEVEEAKMIARRMLANDSVQGYVTSEDYAATLNHLVDPPVPPPPPGLVPAGKESTISVWGLSELEKLAASDLSAEEREEARKDILERERELKREWLDSVAPYPDLEGMVEMYRAALPPAFPPDTQMSEVFGDTLVELERSLLGGQTLPEARESIAARFDASVAAVKAEREAKK